MSELQRPNRETMRLLMINPGSTSTKVALSEGADLLATKTLHHDPEELQGYIKITDQKNMRLAAIEGFLAEQEIWLQDLAAIVGRGGLLNPLSSGTYVVNDQMLVDLYAGKNGQHASNLGGILAQAMAERVGIPSFVVDPPAVDEFDQVARYSGVPELPRTSQLHALNIRRVALRIAEELDKPLVDCKFIVVHIGGGISVAAVAGGRMIDVNNANNGGPFSPERAGTLPAGDLLKMCFSGEYSWREMQSKVIGQAGLVGYLGTNDGREVEKRIEKGDQQAELVYAAMAYQIAKEIGAMGAVVPKLDGIIYTGGLAYSELLIENIKSYVDYLGPSFVIPGENELLALAEGATRVLQGREQAKVYCG